MGMKTWTCAALIVGAAAGCGSNRGAAAPEREYTMEEEMAAWMAVGSPGPEHALLASHVGDWTVAATAWMEPSQPPHESTGTARIRMIFDGRYQVMDYEGSMMGAPFQGMGITGFDNFTKKYFSTWFDSMSTMMMTSEGTADASGKVVTYTSAWDDPLGRRTVSRQISTHTDADHMTFEMYCRTGSKPETKMMELRFTRKR